MKHNAIIARPALLLTAAVAAGTIACMHMKPSTMSLDNCVACTANGPVAQNQGAVCSYSMEPDLSVIGFCRCLADYDCKSSGTNHVFEELQDFKGTCNSGVCEAWPDGTHGGWMLQKGMTRCPQPET